MLVLFAGLCMLASIGYSQTRTSFAIRAGINFQNLNGEEPGGHDLDNKLKTGFHVGVEADIPVAEEFYFRPGVLYSQKGAKLDDPDDTKVNIGYIEVPLSFVYKPVLGTGKLILGIGPYLAYGIGGKVKSNDGDENIKFENKISLSEAMSGTPYVKGFDAGGNIFFGYEFSQRFFAQINAQLGMVNINPKIEGVDDDDRGKTKNTGFGLSVGYRF
jgi:hypothetical protein